MADIVQSLFGLTPEAYQQNQADQASRMALNFAQLTPMQQAQYGIARGAYQLGGALGGALGGQDPMLQMISNRQAIARQIDPTNIESMTTGIQALNQAGDTVGAMQLTQVLRQMQSEMAQRTQREAAAQASLASAKTSEAQERKILSSVEQTENLRNALVALGENPTDEQITNTLLRFGPAEKALSVVEARRAMAQRTAEQEQARKIQGIVQQGIVPGQPVMEELAPSTVGTEALGPEQVVGTTAPTFNIERIAPQLLAMGPGGRAELAALYDLQNKQSIAARQAAQERRAELTAQREELLQSELSKLPRDATEEQISSVLRRYGDPKTVLQALERRSNLQLQLDERRRMEEERQRARQEQAERDQQFQREMAALRNDFRVAATAPQRQLIQMRMDDLAAKKQDAIDRQLSSAEGVVQGTQIVLNKVAEAEKLIGSRTTGFGSYLSVVPGTQAKQLASVIATIKARLGFDQLQQMRNASPTGGALGQVAVKELEALQSAIASLDQTLDAQPLRENLRQIRESYSRWQQAALGKLPEQRRSETGPEPRQTAPGAVVDFNSLPK